MELKSKKCYNLLKKGSGSELIYLIEIRFVRCTDGTNRFILEYTEIYGSFQCGVDFEDVVYISEAKMTKSMKDRLISKGYIKDKENK